MSGPKQSYIMYQGGGDDAIVQHQQGLNAYVSLLLDLQPCLNGCFNVGWRAVKVRILFNAVPIDTVLQSKAFHRVVHICLSRGLTGLIVTPLSRAHTNSRSYSWR